MKTTNNFNTLTISARNIHQKVFDQTPTVLQTEGAVIVGSGWTASVWNL